ncbi:hypothetical protein TD95_002450 [Thielaviopsis punctulata]|uniref:TauD/TfdA-like domain-containing protein n=1 Tax=Thielaviopsis punctulata TaxID=72032 RepID=A0A0F4Z8I5_9PEZI|nr:hypothetical protein TD95_002450 [Thielaviopsis punctulata]
MFTTAQSPAFATTGLKRSVMPTVPSPMLWTNGSSVDSSSYILELSDAQIEELHNALKQFKSLNIDGREISKENFALPTLGPLLEKATQEVHFGCGIFLVRGLKPEVIGPEDLVLLFLGISSYIGEDRGMQDALGNMLVHLRHDKEHFSGTGPTRHSNKHCDFHNDKGTDILSLFVLETAAVGGETLLASVEAVVGRLKTTHPEIVETLKSPEWNFSYKGPLHPAATRPVLYEHNGRTMMDMSFSAREIKRMSAKHKAALAVVERTARNLHVELLPVKGDMIFLNNRGVLHGRSQFFDGEYTGTLNRRHYIRLHLRNKQLSWDLPGPLRTAQTTIFDTQAGLEQRWAVWDSETQRFNIDMYDFLDSH